MKKTSYVLIFILCAILLDVALWHDIFFAHPARAGDYFLDVGQGDSELVILSGGAKILIDAGPDDSVISALEKMLSENDRYIDVAILSYAEPADFGGFSFLLDHYKIGAFIWNGRSPDPPNAQWAALIAKLKSKNIPVVSLLRGDKIIYANNEVDILAPDVSLNESKTLSDTSYVELITTPQFRTLLTGDIAAKTENFLLKQGDDIRADVLKVAHHGAKTSSGKKFLSAVNPSVAVIEVGAGNRYYPATDTIARIASSTSATIFRTDQNGTVEILENSGRLNVKNSK